MSTETHNAPPVPDGKDDLPCGQPVDKRADGSRHPAAPLRFRTAAGRAFRRRLLLPLLSALMLAGCLGTQSPKEVPAVAPTLDSLWNFQDPAASERAFREALENGRFDRAETLTQLARAQGLQRRFDDARATLATVPLAQATPRLAIRHALETGRIERSSGNPPASIPHFERAWNIAVEAGEDALAVDAAHMLAIVADPAGALQWNEKALALAAKSRDPQAQRWRASLLNNIGWTHHDAGRYPEALACFEQAVPLREALGQPYEHRVARWCVARCLRSLGRNDEALALQRALADEADAAAQPDGYIHEELGELLLLSGEKDAARPHFRRAAELLGADPWFADNEKQRLERLRSLAGLD